MTQRPEESDDGAAGDAGPHHHLTPLCAYTVEEADEITCHHRLLCCHRVPDLAQVPARGA